MASGATTPALQQAFSEHLGKTRMHVARLERTFEDLSETTDALTCEAVSAIIGEMERCLQAGGDNDVRDAGLIVAARKLHHYKTAACACLRALALRLSDTGAAERLAETLEDERKADEQLARIADSSVNLNAGNRSKTKADFDVSIF